MKREPYIDYDREEMILRDVLALHRTKLANERTFLAYMRTGITFVVAGITLIKLFPSEFIGFVGYVFLPIGSISILYGIFSYFKTRGNFLDLDREILVEE